MDVVLCFIENIPSYKNQADSIFKKYRIPPAAGGGVARASIMHAARVCRVNGVMLMPCMQACVAGSFICARVRAHRL
jgi:hypothetical protein